MGGKRKNMSNAKRRELAVAGMGRGPSGKAIVAGMKDRDTNQVVAKVVASADKPTLHGFLGEHLDPSATVYTDEAAVYEKVPYTHQTVNHSVSQYVSDMAHVNGLESFWSLLKRGFHGTYHKMSPKHLDRYVQEFATRHNIRNADTIDQMRIIVESMARKRLRYRDLIRDNGLDSGARSTNVAFSPPPNQGQSPAGRGEGHEDRYHGSAEDCSTEGEHDEEQAGDPTLRSHCNRPNHDGEEREHDPSPPKIDDGVRPHGVEGGPDATRDQREDGREDAEDPGNQRDGPSCLLHDARRPTWGTNS